MIEKVLLDPDLKYACTSIIRLFETELPKESISLIVEEENKVVIEVDSSKAYSTEKLVELQNQAEKLVPDSKNKSIVLEPRIK